MNRNIPKYQRVPDNRHFQDLYTSSEIRDVEINLNQRNVEFPNLFVMRR